MNRRKGSADQGLFIVSRDDEGDHAIILSAPSGDSVRNLPATGMLARAGVHCALVESTLFQEVGSMSLASNRRQFLGAAASASAFAGMSQLGFFSKLPVVSAEEAKPDPKIRSEERSVGKDW